MTHDHSSTSKPPETGFSGQGLGCIRAGRVVFAGLDFHLRPGDALFLLGPNGSGKSSLLRMMAGLLRPAAGRLGWDDAKGDDDPVGHAARMHYVGHHDAIKTVLTVAENLKFWAGMHGGGDGVDRRVQTALDRFGLSHLAATPGKMLSAGQKRRANLSRLLSAPAPLWLLDEPATALDKASVAVLEQVMADHRAAGGMVVLSTHQDIILPEAGILRMSEYAPHEDEDDDGDEDDGGDDWP